jgi:phosphatidylinositol alpha-1,6-mannosyltransferase
VNNARILLITDDYPPLRGGIATYLRDLYADRPASELSIVTAPPSSTFLPLRLLAIAAGAYKVMRRRKTDVIHVGTLLPSGVVVMLRSRVFGIAYSVHVYGTELTTTRRSARMQRAVRRLLLGASRVIVISDFAAEQTIRLGVAAGRIVKIAPPVDAERFHPAATPRASSHDGESLLTVARLIPRKGIDTVIRAVALLRESFPRLQYRIVGEGSDRARLERLATELGVDDHVEFAGDVDDVVPEYQRCDIFVMASRTIASEGEVEGFGIAFSEASACGKPVVGGRSGGVPEAVIDGLTGVLVPPDDPVTLAQTLTRLLRNRDERERLGRQGRAHAEATLSVSAARERLRMIAEEVAEERR